MPAPERLQHAFDFLEADSSPPDPAMIVVFGDDDFLRRLVIERLLNDLARLPDDDIPPFSRFDGDRCEWRDVADELSTSSLFGGSTNIVVLENGDKFVKNYRGQLEELATHGASRGVLVLVVQTWLRNTRLAKQVETTGLAIQCKAPEKAQRGGSPPIDTKRIAQWMEKRAKNIHEFEFARGAAEELVELVGPTLGLIDQQMAKLALYAGRGGKVTTQMVIDYVGGWKTKTTWDLLDAMNEGRAGEALLQMDHLLQSGEVPIALHAAMAWSLRRFAVATRLIQHMERDGQRPNLRDALVRAGFRNFPGEMAKVESQLKSIGRVRAAALFQELLRTDLQLKGTHSAADRSRWVLERLALQLSREALPGRTASMPRD